MTLELVCESCGADTEFRISPSNTVYIQPCKCVLDELNDINKLYEELEDLYEKSLNQLASCRKHAPELFL